MNPDEINNLLDKMASHFQHIRGIISPSYTDSFGRVGVDQAVATAANQGLRDLEELKQAIQLLQSKASIE
jgi:hypothetical protein